VEVVRDELESSRSPRRPPDDRNSRVRTR